jgi:hypothetical protein
VTQVGRAVEGAAGEEVGGAHLLRIEDRSARGRGGP